MESELQWAWRMAVALAIGLLVGIERGWRRREEAEGDRVAGLRTFGLVGLVGGLAGLLAGASEMLVLGLGFVGVSLLVAAGYKAGTRSREDVGMTTEVAVLATFLLAAMAGLGHLTLAASGAVVMLLLLSQKSLLHGWLERLKYPELVAGIKLLLISVVLLPLLPNRGIGPWNVLNPYVIWWMVVLIAALSFVGYFAIRIAGARAGTIFTALFGGLASSTAVTLSLARMARKRNADPALLAGGILLACGTMFPRMLLVASVIHAPLFGALVWPALAMAAVTYGAAAWLLRSGDRGGGRSGDLLPNNPLELTSALAFGLLLAVVMVLGRALTEWLGKTGTYLLAAASGIADVDAITLSLARMSADDLAPAIAATGIVIAAAVNSLVKASMALAIGGRALGSRTGIPLALAVVAGIGIAVAAVTAAV